MSFHDSLKHIYSLVCFIGVRTASFAGRAGGELLQRVCGVQPRAGHLPHGSEEAGCGRPQHGALHEGLPGETPCHAAGAVCLREGTGAFNMLCT